MKVIAYLIVIAFASTTCPVFSAETPSRGDAEKILFCIGARDGSAKELGLANETEQAYAKTYQQSIVFTVGTNKPADWPYVHPSSLDQWAGTNAHTYAIRFRATPSVPAALNLIIGVLAIHPMPSTIAVTVNSKAVASLRLPAIRTQPNPNNGWEPAALVLALPENAVIQGENTIGITLNDGSWMVYDYVMLTTAPEPPEAALATTVLVAKPGATSWTEPPLALIPDVDVNTAIVKHKMAGGIGASWHAIRNDVPPKDRGSAWGGNPPLENAKAWEQVRQHARWLGLDWIRVELDQRMYEPARGAFDWENDEMQTLYRVLDWCEANHADVFLTQMFSHIEWNKIPGQDVVRSAPKSVDDFAEGLATLVEHLLNKKKYTCIHWLCITNEPNNWWSGGCSLTEGLKAVRKALDAKGIILPLSGPDTYDRGPGDDFGDTVGAYDIHTYNVDGVQRRELLAQWSEWAHTRKKPFFLSEFGVPQSWWGTGCKSYKAVLSNVATVLNGLSVGVDGFNRWSYLNRGNIDGHWQLVRTWDIEKKQYLAEATPEPVPYMGYALVTRFAAKHSEILACSVKGGRGKVLAAALRSPKGNLTIWALNLIAAEQEINVTVSGLKEDVSLYPYQATEAELQQPGFTLRPGKVFKFSPGTARMNMKVPALSITTLTTFALAPEDPGVIEDIANEPRK